MEKALLEIKNLNVVYDTDDARVFAVNGINLVLHGKSCADGRLFRPVELKIPAHA